MPSLRVQPLAATAPRERSAAPRARRPSASASASAATGAVINPVVGTAAVSFGFSLSGTGQEEWTGTSAVSFGFSLTGSGTATLPLVTGTAAVSFTFSLTGTGKYKVRGTGAVAFGFSLSASGSFLVTGTAPRGSTGAIEYVVEIFDSGATFGPGTKVGELWDARNIGWSRYDRLPGKAFLSLYQDSPHLAVFSPLVSHIKITRVTPLEDIQVYAGAFIDYDSTGDDVIL